MGVQCSLRQECSICLENVMGKENPSERRFGLLSCDHSFCLACVRGWRSHVDGGADVDSVSPGAPFTLGNCIAMSALRSSGQVQALQVWKKREDGCYKTRV